MPVPIMTISGFTGSGGSLLVAVTSNDATPVSTSLALITATCTSLPFGGQRVVPASDMPWKVGGLLSEDGPSVRLAPLNPNPRGKRALIPDASVLKLNSVEKPVLSLPIAYKRLLEGSNARPPVVFYAVVFVYNKLHPWTGGTLDFLTLNVRSAHLRPELSEIPLDFGPIKNNASSCTLDT
jgi:hypothetical protein